MKTNHEKISNNVSVQVLCEEHNHGIL